MYRSPFGQCAYHNKKRRFVESLRGFWEFGWSSEDMLSWVWRCPMNRIQGQAIGHQDVTRFARQCVTMISMSQDPSRQFRLSAEIEVVELSKSDVDQLTALASRYVDLLATGVAGKLNDVVHSQAVRLPLNDIIDAFHAYTDNLRPTRTVVHHNRCVPLSSGLWVPLVLKFAGRRDDQLFSMIVWPDIDRQWKITAAIDL